jgi:uncharacterized membrane-anchored protein YitT (DUF2179 family)
MGQSGRPPKCPFGRLRDRITPKKAADFLLVNLGLALTALGIAVFKAPNHFAIGGVSGLAIIAQSFFPHLRVGLFMTAINVLLLALSLLLLGRDYTLRTVAAGFALSFYTWIIEEIVPLSAPLTGEPLLELAFAILLPATGSAIVFNLNASTGGTDILAAILSRHTPLSIGRALLATDFAVTVGAIFVFGIQTGLMCILGLIIKATLVDVVIDSINVRKCFVIISDRHELIERFIMEKLHRGATIHAAWGAYSHEEKRVITTALSRRQAVLLRDYIRQVDRNAFITITNSSEIIGKGFRNL